MRRIVVVNLHSNWMWLKNSAVLIFGDSPATKHSYLLEYLLQHPDEYELCNFINSRGFSLYRHGSDTLQRFLNFFSLLENKYILKKNRIPKKSVRIIKDASEIHTDDIVICYNAMKDTYADLEKIKGFKVASMIHFGGNADEDEMIKRVGISCFYNETNLSKSSEIYKRYYHNEIPWLVVPFVFAKRFENRKPFSERRNKCFSTGTITYKTNPEFLEVYGDPCDQPARKFVMDNQDYFKDTVDCYSCNYEEDNTDSKEINPLDLQAVKLYKKIHNRFHAGRQKKYFSFNMVEKFNEYKMHLVGEEILGVPGIGFVEGMACGSAYIGLDSPMYRDYGLVPGVHYITYDGTKEGLKSTVEFWQKDENQEELERIARTGCEFVRENFCGPKVAERLLEALKSEQKNRKYQEK